MRACRRHFLALRLGATQCNIAYMMYDDAMQHDAVDSMCQHLQCLYMSAELESSDH